MYIISGFTLFRQPGKIAIRVACGFSGSWVEGVDDGDEEDAVEDYEKGPPAIEPGFI